MYLLGGERECLLLRGGKFRGHCDWRELFKKYIEEQSAVKLPYFELCKRSF